MLVSRITRFLASCRPHPWSIFAMENPWVTNHARHRTRGAQLLGQVLAACISSPGGYFCVKRVGKVESGRHRRPIHRVPGIIHCFPRVLCDSGRSVRDIPAGCLQADRLVLRRWSSDKIQVVLPFFHPRRFSCQAERAIDPYGSPLPATYRNPNRGEAVREEHLGTRGPLRSRFLPFLRFSPSVSSYARSGYTGKTRAAARKWLNNRGRDERTPWYFMEGGKPASWIADYVVASKKAGARIVPLRF